MFQWIMYSHEYHRWVFYQPLVPPTFVGWNLFQHKNGWVAVGKPGLLN